MNATQLPPIPADAAASASESPSAWMAPGIAAVVALFDICFWAGNDFPGLSLAVFFAGTAVMIGLSRRRLTNRARRTPATLGRSGWIALALLAGAICEAGIETGFCNILMLLLLTGAFAAETYFTGRSPGLDRWSAQVRASFLAPCRFLELCFALVSRLLLRAGLAGRFGAAVVILVPTVLLTVLFGLLLSNGNAVFGLWAGDAFRSIGTIFPEVSFGRVLLWLFVATGAVALLWPSNAPGDSWNWAARLGRWPDAVPAELAVISSTILLVALNALFAVANYADAVFLWRGGSLPAGVSYSQFVHEGVDMLIVTVLLSAVVLATIFNQAAAVASRRGLKLLGFLWVAQNLFLIVSTAERLDLYIGAYGASVERFGVLIFLLLVAAGFGLLSVTILRGKSMAWLVGRAFAAVFLTLYLAQFLNLGGWAADYNVARWARDRSQTLDVNYLEELGPAAWPAWMRARDLGAIQWVNDERSPWPGSPIEQEKSLPETRLDHGHWREFSLRAWWNRGALRE